MAKKIFTGPEVEPASGKDLRSCMVMLHGVGANGDDLISLAPIFAEELPDTQFIAPNGPEKFHAGNGGYQWFPYWEHTHQQIIQGCEKAADNVAEYLYQVADELRLNPADMILLGFSQGAMVAIQTALTMQDNIGAVLAFSGGLLKVDITEFEVRSQPPVCLIHGSDDDVVPCQMSEVSSHILHGLHVPAEFHRINGLGHSIDMRGIDIAKTFLNKYIK